ncbi:hypothetical protein [Sporosarcina sp. SAFN-010]|uniref:hypothetical protein n=1 Tax=Sporosarcina sp. SAFN-010 TaxID=3387273 RepID=UPI003F7D024F
MAITFNQHAKVTVAPTGWSNATVKKLAMGNPVNTVVGQSDTLFVTFLTDDSHLVRHSFLMAAGVSHLLEKLVGVTMREGEGLVDLEELIDYRCGIEIAHRLGQNDRLFVNVVDVCALHDLVEEDEQPSEESLEEEFPIFGGTDIE